MMKSFRRTSSYSDYDNILFTDKSPDLYRLVLQRRHKNKVMVGKHLDIHSWLEILSLQEYLPVFKDYASVEDLLLLNEADLRDLGVKDCTHRTKIVSSLCYLRDNYKNLPDKRNSWSQLSNAPPPPPSYFSPTIYDNNQNATNEKLQLDLHLELQGNPGNLRSYSWYHGQISRLAAEQLVVVNGDYLVRDSVSQPGDFVLSCGWHGVPMHFIINSKVLIDGYAEPKIIYLLEDDEFNSIPSLIDYYVKNSKPVTKASNVILKKAIARQLPLSSYDMKYGSPMNKNSGFYSSTPNISPKPSPFVTPNTTPPGSPTGMKDHLHKRTGSQPVLCLEQSSCDAPFSPTHLGRSDSVPSIGYSSPLSPIATPTMPSPPIHHTRCGSEPILSPQPVNPTFLTVPENSLNPASSESSLFKAPPPKPSRVASIKTKQRPTIEIRNAALYDDEMDYSELDQVVATPSWIKADKKLEFTYQQNLKNVSSVQGTSTNKNGKSLLKNKFPSKSKFPSGKDSINEEYTEQIFDVNYMKAKEITIPNDKSFRRSYNLQNYCGTLIPDENKPLDVHVFFKVYDILMDNPRRIAQHLTKIDVEFIRVLGEDDLGAGVLSGLELITLPQGSVLRQDILERCYTMQVFVATTILIWNKIVMRAQVLSKWIQVATELKNTLGNLFGFVNVMEGIGLKQVKRLRDTWLILRQDHTGSAMIYDKKLRGVHQTLTEGSFLLPLQNVSIPNILPVVSLMEKTLETMMDMMPWETNNSTFDLESFFVHLDTARLISSQIALYKMSSQSLTGELREAPELQEVLRTEFQVRLLWGKKGSVTNPLERYEIFDKILTAMSNQREEPGNDGTAV
ncbi:breast cancer anti-estrogen resistance protein 3 homolog isoform X1 [Octopus bimaculoides]|uniref:SH2 domain-containing protein n=2 Tax=Octopus bimaculoides TaxID=37653 RepID=A0A0L8GV37_OCTBM|nr:breast cancer anti-estrogen resistance protein 3 homolog isoform X1 [Octopus bimaculoides]|eukprot:XP_014777821.1 PREDICTED: breast cancer anti-estrogen resistance protein 3-like [Octopus bimaculoides]